MSIPASYLVDEAALRFGDPNKSRIQPNEWTVLYNAAQRELCQKANLLEFRSTFDLAPIDGVTLLPTTSALYAYPLEMTRLTRLEGSESPSDPDSFRDLHEKFEDEWRAQIYSRYPTGARPWFYYAAKSGFWLLPRPVATIAGGGRITYYGLPDRVTDYAAATFQLPDVAQDYQIRRMVIAAKMVRNRVAEANAELAAWLVDVGQLVDTFDDRADDRRSSLRQHRSPFAGMNILL